MRSGLELGRTQYPRLPLSLLIHQYCHDMTKIHWRSDQRVKHVMYITFPPSLQKRWISPLANPTTKRLASWLVQDTAVAGPLKGCSDSNSCSPEATDQTTALESSPNHLLVKRRGFGENERHQYWSNGYSPSWQRDNSPASYGIEEYSEVWTARYLSLRVWYCLYQRRKSGTISRYDPSFFFYPWVASLSFAWVFK